ncbi:hypothetical protein GALL_105130 [mine drainage metagenome]|uniref:Uncharacterized protein n=1 Tax=mine drainage metagenome TaxID=410659 RepID=A0A1J5SFN9_9ZZZZ
MKSSRALILAIAAAFIGLAFSPLCNRCFELFSSAEGLISFYALAGILLLGIGDYASRRIHSRRS